jgi:hypothetical protein
MSSAGDAVWCNNGIVTTILALACRSLPDLRRATLVCRSWAALLTGPEAPGLGLWLGALGLAPDFSESSAVAWQALSLLRAVEWFPATKYDRAHEEWEGIPIKIRQVRCRGLRLRALPFMRVLAVHSCSGAEFDDWTNQDDFFQLLLPSTNPSTREFTGVSALVSLDIRDQQGSHTVQIGRTQLTAFRDCLTALDLPAARLSDAHLIGLLFHVALFSTHYWRHRRTIRRPSGDHDCRGQSCELCDFDPCPVGYVLQAAAEGLLAEFPPGEEDMMTIVCPANDPVAAAPMWDCFHEALNIVFPEVRWGQSHEEEEEEEDQDDDEEAAEDGDYEDEDEEEHEEEDHEDGGEGGGGDGGDDESEEGENSSAPVVQVCSAEHSQATSTYMSPLHTCHPRFICASLLRSDASPWPFPGGSSAPGREQKDAGASKGTWWPVRGGWRRVGQRRHRDHHPGLRVPLREGPAAGHACVPLVGRPAHGGRSAWGGAVAAAAWSGIGYVREPRRGLAGPLPAPGRGVVPRDHV